MRIITALTAWQYMVAMNFRHICKFSTCHSTSAPLCGEVRNAVIRVFGAPAIQGLPHQRKHERHIDTKIIVQFLEYAMALPATKSGDKYRVEVINPVHYASYAELGHDKYNRRREYTGWKEGQYFLNLSEQDLRKLAPGIIEEKLEKELKKVFSV